MMLNQATRIKITVTALLAIAGLFVGVFVGQHVRAPKDMSQFHGTWLDNPRPISSFAFKGTDNKPFTNFELQGRWTMLFFGFTSCPSVCPTTMGELAKMYRDLEDMGVKSMPNVVLVSLDPARDNSEKLSQYVKAFNPNFMGASGDDEDSVKSIAKEMGIAYAKIDARDVQRPEDYTIEHTGTVMLVNPRGQLTAFFTSPLKAQFLAEDYKLAAG